MDSNTTSSTCLADPERGNIGGGSHPAAWPDVRDVEDWQDHFLRAAEDGLRRPKDEEVLKEEQIKKLNQKIEEFVVENDVLQEALKLYPFVREMSDA